MMWYIPTWNGDLRLAPSVADKDKTVLTIVKPTIDEMRVANAIVERCAKEGWLPEGWLDTWTPLVPGQPTTTEPLRENEAETLMVVHAPLEKVGPVVAKLLRPGAAVLTAITFMDGRVVTSSGTEAELAELAAQVALEPKKTEAKAAATVRRPTPCCPRCIPGAVAPASEVLLAFLSPEEHREWAKTRTIHVNGGLSGHRYLLAHRHTKQAQEHGRICYDLDDRCVVHFHDWAVPPEEEVLAAKLILEHREPWLRNEATLWDAWHASDVFKNPFGDVRDGTMDAALTEAIGATFLGMKDAARGAAS